MASGLDPLYFRLRNAINNIQAPDTPAVVLEREVTEFLLNTPPDENFVSDVERNTYYGGIDPNFDDFDNFLSRLRNNINNEFAAGVFPVDVVDTRINQPAIQDLYRNKVNAARKAFMVRYHTGRYETQLKSLDAENKLIDQRITSFLSAQAILFAALAIAADPTKNTVFISLKFVIPLIGIFSSIFTYYVNVLAFYSAATLETQIPQSVRNIVGFFFTLYDNPNDILRTPPDLDKRIRRWFYKLLLPPTSIPFIFLIGWVWVIIKL